MPKSACVCVFLCVYRERMGLCVCACEAIAVEGTGMSHATLTTQSLALQDARSRTTHTCPREIQP